MLEDQIEPSGSLEGAADGRTRTSRCVVCYQPLHLRQGCLVGRWASRDFPPFSKMWCLARTRDWYFAVGPVNNVLRLTRWHTELVHSVLIAFIGLYTITTLRIHVSNARRCWQPPYEMVPLTAVTVHQPPSFLDGTVCQSPSIGAS